MPIIDSSSSAKFDALVRINKAESLMSFIMATYNANKNANKKAEVAKRLKSAYELFREDVKGSNTGAGTYGLGDRNVIEQFESHYTMGYEMGIWEDSNFTLTPLAIEVAKLNITVKEYIGRVFLNLFTYYTVDGEDRYHHFLYEVLNSAKRNGVINGVITKNIISDSLPNIENKSAQTNLIFNYLIGTEFFEKVDRDNMSLSSNWNGKGEELLEKCNLEFMNKSKDEAFAMAKDKKQYARYVTKSEKNVVTSEKKEVKKPVEIGTNVLLYGVPGSGKSYSIDEKIGYANYERVVFHPDYSYSDFVGQIMPKLKEEKLTYEFVPGPFTKALKASYCDENNMHYLVIEEINRGNAPAIFGDIFQLLDREDDGSGKYCITNFDIAKEVHGDEMEPIRIPKNLSILATMNTSDQNVFTLDTAFQRRWNMEYIPNNINEAIHANNEIQGSNITWGQFASVINEEIVEYNRELASSEDKQLGAYFVRESELTTDKFPKKALKYLWDDAFKLDREKVFASDIKSIGDLIESYDEEAKQGNDPIKRVMDANIFKRMMDMSAASVADAIDNSEVFEADVQSEEI